MDNPNVRDRYRGSMLGLAAGDALGTTLEFSRPGTFEPITEIVGGGPFDLIPGEWTDDTSMALCLAASLIETKGFDPIDQLRRYTMWWEEGYMSSTGACFDIGITVRAALNRFKQTGEAYCGSTDPYSAGNGSIMRLAPVPLFYARDPALAIERSADSSRTTHAAVECIDACRYFGALIVGVVMGATKGELLGDHFDPVGGIWSRAPLAPKLAAIASGAFKQNDISKIRGSGYVVDSLEAALWAFYNSETFEDGALMAVNLGDDADTTGAVYGQLAGAYYGESGIPEEWRRIIANRSLIEQIADNLESQAHQPIP
jgi:ADP-ribosylglycohydrolase